MLTQETSPAVGRSSSSNGTVLKALINGSFNGNGKKKIYCRRLQSSIGDSAEVTKNLIKPRLHLHWSISL